MKAGKRKKINFYRNEIRSYLPNYADEDLMKVQWEPLIIEKDEWEILEKGVKQRFLAINRYVKDFYLNKNIIIPNEIMFESKFYNKDLLNVETNYEFVSNLYGVDIMRSLDGELYVIEDNFARPGGMQYAIDMRKMFDKYITDYNISIHDIEDFNSTFYSAFVDDENDNVAILTRGPGASGGYEFHKLCDETKMISISPEDICFFDNELLYRNSKNELIKIDGLYNRLTFRRFPEAYHILCNALHSGAYIQTFPGYEIGGDKAVYPYVPDLIKYYLNEEPILKQPKTYICCAGLKNEWELYENSCVIKQRCGYGGKEVFFSEELSENELNEIKNKIYNEPYQYIIQEKIEADSQIIYNPDKKKNEKAIYDMRIFCIGDKKGKMNVMKGGICRSVFNGEKKVNISKNGVVRNIWVKK